MDRERRSIQHLLFEIGVWGKAIDGVLEVIGGALLFLISPLKMNSILRALTQHELSEDPHDWFVRLVTGAEHLSSGKRHFAALYLLWHGLVKVGLVAGLMLRKRWAYPAAIGAFGLFVVYQVYRYLLVPSTGLLVLTALDLIVIVLTWMEYRRLQRRGALQDSGDHGAAFEQQVD